MKTLTAAIRGTLCAALLVLSGTALAAGNHPITGGPIYFGEPALPTVAAVIQAGGGPANFSFTNALIATLGMPAVQAEMNKLSKTYGEDKVNTSMRMMTFAVQDAIKRAAESQVKLPEAADEKGQKLVTDLVKLGVAPDNTFWVDYLFDRLVTHDLHQQVELDMNAEFGSVPVEETYRIMNQAMYDMAQQLGMKDVKLAPFH
ncbi:MAG: hypothetical protein EPN72_06625 [Nevskiaceae bacterium]|nr:MAG: hypothetical protein EPN63_10325 [Nevskiaceae bacterium]TBR73357.1 MAG: hypothetical protein EPN72_06625 [Nevskiaceae bacterium]